MPLSVLPAMWPTISAGSVTGVPSEDSSARASCVPMSRTIAVASVRTVSRPTASDPDAGTLGTDRQVGRIAILDLQAEGGEIGGAIIGNGHELHAAIRTHEQQEAIRRAAAIVGIGIADLAVLQPPLAGIGATLLPVSG